jgi:hypothetical protein
MPINDDHAEELHRLTQEGGTHSDNTDMLREMAENGAHSVEWQHLASHWDETHAKGSAAAHTISILQNVGGDLNNYLDHDQVSEMKKEYSQSNSANASFHDLAERELRTSGWQPPEEE